MTKIHLFTLKKSAIAIPQGITKENHRKTFENFERLTPTVKKHGADRTAQKTVLDFATASAIEEMLKGFITGQQLMEEFNKIAYSYEIMANGRIATGKLCYTVPMNGGEQYAPSILLATFFHTVEGREMNPYDIIEINEAATLKKLYNRLKARANHAADAWSITVEYAHKKNLLTVFAKYYGFSTLKLEIDTSTDAETRYTLTWACTNPSGCIIHQLNIDSFLWQVFKESKTEEYQSSELEVTF